MSAHEKVVQCILFVKFNFLRFGDEVPIPASLKEPVLYHYAEVLVFKLIAKTLTLWPMPLLFDRYNL